MNPLVSIIMPTYKGTDNICIAIDAALRQTYDNIEIIVVDDNGEGTENQIETEKLLQKYIKDNKIRYIRHKKNINGSAARNTGMKVSSGKYISFLDDDDDVLMPEKIEKQVRLFEQLDDGFGLVYCSGYVVKSTGVGYKLDIVEDDLSHNFGAFLQAYALTMRLREEFPQDRVELINFNMLAAEKYYKKVIWSENRFRTMKYNKIRYKSFEMSQNMLPVGKKELHSNSIEEFTEMVRGEYDIIIAGSDEIWRLTGSRGFPNPYWLPGDLGSAKMSYAASSRSNFDAFDDEGKKKLKALLDDFDYIGVRDKSTYDSVRKTVDDKEKVHMNCDPTLAYKFNFSRDKGRKLLRERFGVDSEKQTIGIMVTDPSIVKSLKSELGDGYNYVSLFQKHKGTFSCADIRPFEWIDVVSALDFFVTSFFHGMCFAVNTGVPFAGLEKNKVDKEKSKAADFLIRAGLDGRYVPGEFEKLRTMINNEIGTTIDYEPFVADLRKEFEGFLESVRRIKEKKV